MSEHQMLFQDVDSVGDVLSGLISMDAKGCRFGTYSFNFIKRYFYEMRKGFQITFRLGILPVVPVLLVDSVFLKICRF